MTRILKALAASVGGAAILAAATWPATAADFYPGGYHVRHVRHHAYVARLGYGYGGYGRHSAYGYGPVSEGGYGYGYVGEPGTVPVIYGPGYTGYYQYPVGYGAGVVPYGYGYGTGNWPGSGLYGLGY